MRYTIENKGQTRLQTRFGCEWNINLLGGGANDQAYYAIDGHTLDNSHFDSTGEVQDVASFHIGNSWIGQDLGFSLSHAATLWRFSIETVTGSEAGFERNHQGSCLTLLWPLVLEAGQSWQVEIRCARKSPPCLIPSWLVEYKAGHFCCNYKNAYQSDREGSPWHANVSLFGRFFRMSGTETAASTAQSVTGYAHPEVLVETSWVADHLNDPSVRLIEADEDVLLYEVGHLPGAIKLDWHVDVQDPLSIATSSTRRASRSS